jgi:hypothetical protein
MSESASKLESNIKPILQFSVLCDRYVQTPSGKPNFEEVFSLLLKTGTYRFFVVNRFINGLGVHKQKLRFYKPNAIDFKEGPTNEFKIENRAFAIDIATQAFFDFDETGVWWLQVLLDDEPILSYPIPVYE